jgi:hypothetical protein
MRIAAEQPMRSSGHFQIVSDKSEAYQHYRAVSVRNAYYAAFYISQGEPSTGPTN